LKGLKEEICTEIPSWFKAGLPAPGKEDYLAGTVHGLGLLLVLALGISGAIMLYGMEESGKMLGFVHDMKELHEILGTILWVYIVGHVGMVIIHQLFGHPMFQRIFSLKD